MLKIGQKRISTDPTTEFGCIGKIYDPKFLDENDPISFDGYGQTFTVLCKSSQLKHGLYIDYHLYFEKINVTTRWSDSNILTKSRLDVSYGKIWNKINA